MERVSRSSRQGATILVALMFLGVGVAGCSNNNSATTSPASSASSAAPPGAANPRSEADASKTSMVNSAPTSTLATSTTAPGSSSSATDATRSTTSSASGNAITTVAPPPTTPEGYAQVLVAAWRSGDRALAATVADGATVTKLFGFAANPNDFAFLECGGAAGSTICRFGGGPQELIVSVRNTTGGLAMQVNEVRLNAP